MKYLVATTLFMLGCGSSTAPSEKPNAATQPTLQNAPVTLMGQQMVVQARIQVPSSASQQAARSMAETMLRQELLKYLRVEVETSSIDYVSESTSGEEKRVLELNHFEAASGRVAISTPLKIYRKSSKVPGQVLYIAQTTMGRDDFVAAFGEDYRPMARALADHVFKAEVAQP